MRDRPLPMTKNKDMPIPKWEFVSLMAAIFGLQAMGIDIMLPALELIGEHYAIQKQNDQQLIIFAFIIGFGFPQLIFGPISDRFVEKSYYNLA